MQTNVLMLLLDQSWKRAMKWLSVNTQTGSHTAAASTLSGLFAPCFASLLILFCSVKFCISNSTFTTRNWLIPPVSRGRAFCCVEVTLQKLYCTDLDSAVLKLVWAHVPVTKAWRQASLSALWIRATSASTFTCATRPSGISRVISRRSWDYTSQDASWRSNQQQQQQQLCAPTRPQQSDEEPPREARWDRLWLIASLPSDVCAVSHNGCER